MHRLTRWAFISALLLFPGSGNAMHPLLTDDTGTQGKGKYQLEATATWNTDRDDAGGQGVREIGEIAGVVLTGGASDTLDLMVEVPYVWNETKEAGQTVRNDGLFDTVVAAKWRFFEANMFTLAVKPGITLPTGDETRGLGMGKPGYFAAFIATTEKEPWAFDLNLAYFDVQNDLDERANIWFGSLAVRYQVNGSWKIAGEAGVTRNSDKADSSHPVFAQVGCVYSLTEALDLSAGLFRGVTDTEIDAALRFAATMRF